MRLPLFAISHSAPLGHARKCARVKARVRWTARTSYRRGRLSFYYFLLRRFLRRCVLPLRVSFFIVIFGFMFAATRS